MKVKLAVSNERYHEIRRMLEERGIEIDDNKIYIERINDEPTNVIAVHTHKGCIRQSLDSPTD